MSLGAADGSNAGLVRSQIGRRGRQAKVGDDFGLGSCMLGTSVSNGKKKGDSIKAKVGPKMISEREEARLRSRRVMAHDLMDRSPRLSISVRKHAEASEISLAVNGSWGW